MNTVQRTNGRRARPRVLSVLLMTPMIFLSLFSLAEAGKPGGRPAKSADLGVQSYTARRHYVVGQETVITVLAYSNDANPASSVKVTITLPPELALVEAGGGSVTCSGTSSVVCSIGNMTAFQRVEFPLLVRATTAGWPALTTSIQSTTNDPYLWNNTQQWWFTILEATPLPLNLGCHSGHVTCQIELNLSTTTTLRLGLQTQKGFYGDLRMAVTSLYDAIPRLYWAIPIDSASFDAVGVDETVIPAGTTVTLPAGPHIMTISCCRRSLQTSPTWIPQIGNPNSHVICRPIGFGSLCIPGGVGGNYVPGRSVRAGSGVFSGSASAA